MKWSKAVLLCVGAVALSQCLWGQSPAIGEHHGKGIPGTLDPRTGTFTAGVQRSDVKSAESPPLSGTSVLFREQFNITISNYDYAPSLVVCRAYIYTSDANGYFDEKAELFATQNGNTYSCDVPVLTQWILQTPTTDTIYATVSVEFLQGVTIGSAKWFWTVRSSGQPQMTLSVPSNGQTVVTTLNFTM